MTREEAIKIFNTVLFFGKCDCPKEEIEECLNMTIEALKQEPILDKIRNEIEQLPTSTCTSTCRISIDPDDFKENVFAILDKYKSEKE